jgi:O-antigen ligase
VIRKVYYLAIGLLPIALCFWVYRTVGEFNHPRVYFTYDDALFFLSDALILLAVLLWLTTRISNISQSQAVGSQNIRSSFTFPLFALLILVTLSIAWSQDWRTSLYISLHFWLLFLLILSLRDWHEAWKPAMYGLSVALAIQLIAGFTGFALQSTAFLEPFNMQWPGILEPSMHGVSVVQLGNGLRILRAYGTLPHPNILGGLILVTLLGPASFFLTGRKRNYPALILFSLGIVLAILTFSRSAWLGLIVFFVLLLLKAKHVDHARVFLLVSTAALTAFLTLLPLHDLFFTRIGASTVETETMSMAGRSWITGQALSAIREHPLTGLGIGSFVINLANTAVEGAPIEPVHNVILLATAELGVAGLILIAILFVSVVRSIIRSTSPRAILAGALLAGLGIISLFDHYLWTIAPGRTMLGLALGLWAGQVAHDA